MEESYKNGETRQARHGSEVDKDRVSEKEGEKVEEAKKVQPKGEAGAPSSHEGGSVNEKDAVTIEKKTVFTSTETRTVNIAKSPFLSSKPLKSGEEGQGTARAGEGADSNKKAITDEIDMAEVKRIQDQYENENTKGEVMLQARCKLFRKNQKTGKFEDRGEGEIFVTKDQETDLYKISMVRDQIKTLGCNHFIDPNIDCLSVRTYARTWTWFTSSDSCYTGSKDTKTQFYVVKFGEEKASSKFKSVYDLGKEYNSKVLNKE